MEFISLKHEEREREKYRRESMGVVGDTSILRGRDILSALKVPRHSLVLPIELRLRVDKSLRREDGNGLGSALC